VAVVNKARKAGDRLTGLFAQADEYLKEAGVPQWNEAGAEDPQELKRRKDFIKAQMVERDRLAKREWLKDSAKYDRLHTIRKDVSRARYVTRLSRRGRGLLAAWRNAALHTGASRKTNPKWSIRQRTCRDCEKGTPETPEHLLIDCERHSAARQRATSNLKEKWTPGQWDTWKDMSSIAKARTLRGAYDYMSLTKTQVDHLEKETASLIVNIEDSRLGRGLKPFCSAVVPPPTFCMEDAIWWMENPTERDDLDGSDDSDSEPNTDLEESE